jgi:hypothetical protein
MGGPSKDNQDVVFSGVANVVDSSGNWDYPQSTFPATNHSYAAPRDDNTITHLLRQEGIILDEKTRLQLLQKPMDLKSILEAGVNALSYQTSDMISRNASAGESSTTKDDQLRTDKILVFKNDLPPLPDLHRNHIRIKQVMYVAACMANASSLGFNLQGAECDDIESSFFRDSISESAAKTACITEFTHLRTYLRPTATQMMHRHHPYIDVLPFPKFRERIIKLAYAEDEPMIDEDDLCEDLQKDGLICWGSSLGGGSAAMGSGAPWDLRSWEAQPWFLKKWWILIGGAEGEIYKQTKWWCEMRGERFCNPW